MSWQCKEISKSISQSLRNTIILKHTFSLHQINVVRELELIFPRQCSNRLFFTWRYCWNPLASLAFLPLFHWRFDLIRHLHCCKRNRGEIFVTLQFYLKSLQCDWSTGDLTEHSRTNGLWFRWCVKWFHCHLPTKKWCWNCQQPY